MRHRPTDSLYTVVRWDREAETLLLVPVASRVNSNANSNGSAGKADGARTRWAFERTVSLVETSDSTTKAPKTTTKAAPETRVEGGPSAKGATAAGAASTPANCSSSSSKDVYFDPTPFARHFAKLDSRVEIRRHPKRSRDRGLFAVRNVPRGTEVMRVPAAAAVLLSSKRNDSCGGCLLSTKEVGPIEACRKCSLRFCAVCRKRGGDGDGHGRAGSCELTKQLLRICMTPANGGQRPDEGTLRLMAEVLLRRGAGEVGDEEWDLLESLESQDNENRMMNLAPRVLEECGLLLKELMGLDVPLEDVQAMYRRQAFVV